MLRRYAIVVALAYLPIFIFIVYFLSTGFAVRDHIDPIEGSWMRAVRLATIPNQARLAKNPLSADPALLKRARQHFGDHCASCHGADGRGPTDGPRFDPPPIDLSGPTQSLLDGEIHFIIARGIRFSGMPAFGSGAHADAESWELVHLIRSLPTLRPEELAEIEAANPAYARRNRDRKEEDHFLYGP